MAAAGDDPGAVAEVMKLIDRLGFDAVDAGPLTVGLALQPGGPVFGIAHSHDELSNLLRSAAWRASPRHLDDGSRARPSPSGRLRCTG
jgi:predicted dinucleotide-binding enzyme